MELDDSFIAPDEEEYYPNESNLESEMIEFESEEEQ